VSEVFATESAVSRFGAMLTDAPVHLVTERAAKVLSETVTPVGLVAVCSVPDVAMADVLADGPRLVAVAVEISEPGNAGTLIRVADAMGADAVVLAGNSVDPYNGKCLRASAGSIFSIPVVTEPDAVQAVSALREAGLQVLATTIDGEVSLDDVALGAPTAWLFGPESHGLPTELAEMATHRVRIPIPGSAESLNVASAASICLYQSARTHRLD
jgi:RNA methyltransferase, TrmH family